MRLPHHLTSRSAVALIAPSFRFDVDLFEKGRRNLERTFGIQTTHLKTLFAKHDYFAGTDSRRLRELLYWIKNPNIDALLTVRGGYGVTRIYPDLITQLRGTRNLKPKLILGHSDLTILLNGLFQDLGWVTFHTPVLTGRPFREPLDIEQSTFRQCLFTTKPLGKISYQEMFTLVTGRASGKLIGGNLSMLITSIGTPYEIDTKDRILFLEDVAEAPYRLDRMLTQLIHTGKLDSVKGIIFGQLTNCNPTPATPDVDAWHAVKLAIEKFLKRHKIPTICNFPAGHGSPQITFPIGCTVELRATTNSPSVIFIESGVR